jgi:hypothetical protein
MFWYKRELYEADISFQISYHALNDLSLDIENTTAKERTKQKDGKRSTMTARTKTEAHHFDTDT